MDRHQDGDCVARDALYDRAVLLGRAQPERSPPSANRTIAIATAASALSLGTDYKPDANTIYIREEPRVTERLRSAPRFKALGLEL